MASKDEAQKDLYTKKQREDFDSFIKRIDENEGAVLSAASTARNAEDMDIWLPNFKRQRKDENFNEKTDEKLASSCMEAYKKMRLDGQHRYAKHIVQEDGQLVTHPKKQKALAHYVERGSLFAIVALHMLVLIGVIFGEPALKSVHVHLLTVTLALLALATRAVSDGINFDENLRRYTGYLTLTQNQTERFERARSTQKKINTAWAMEDAASREMIEFLTEFGRARFVM
jgi:hypothetical protein